MEKEFDLDNCTISEFQAYMAGKLNVEKKIEILKEIVTFIAAHDPSFIDVKLTTKLKEQAIKALKKLKETP